MEHYDIMIWHGYGYDSLSKVYVVRIIYDIIRHDIILISLIYKFIILFYFIQF